MCVEAELQLLRDRIEHPELFIRTTRIPETSPLHWAATPTELGEIICSLDLDKAICDANGSKANFTDIVKSFEWFFNIRLGDPRDLKRNIIRRKTRLTVYLDKLRRLLNEYSLKI